MSLFIIEYRSKDWCMADAFRTRGQRNVRRRFKITSEQVGTDDVKEVEKAAKAKESIPDGMVFHSIEQLP